MKHVPDILYGLFVLFVAVQSYQHPAHNWDVIGYAAVALSYDEKDMQRVHDSVYQTLKTTVPSINHYFSLQSGDAYRHEVAQNVQSFSQQLPFYTAKPLYPLLAYALSKFGMNAVQATTLISILSFLLMSVIVFVWLRKQFRGVPLLIASLLLLLVTNLSFVARLSTPDALSGALLLTAFFLYLETSFKLPSVILLSMAILARPDSIIVVGFLFLYFAVRGNDNTRISLGQLVALEALALGILLTVYVATDHYGWKTLFYHTFIQQLNYPADQPVSLSVGDYCYALVRGVRQTIFRSQFNSFPFFLLITFALGFLQRYTPSERRQHIELSSLMIVTVFVHFLLFPDGEAIDRFSVAQFSFVGIVFMTQLSLLFDYGRQSTG